MNWRNQSSSVIHVQIRPVRCVRYSAGPRS